MKKSTLNKFNTFNQKEWDVLNFEFFQNFESPHTRRCYERDIKLFFSFLTTLKISIAGPRELTKAHVVAYKRYLQDSNQAPKTICRKISSISSYFDFLIEKNRIDVNPCHGLRRPKQVVVNETLDLSDESVQKLFNVLFEVEEAENKSILMHRAVIFLLFSTGMRKAELINLTFKDYQQADEQTFCLKIKAKGGKFLLKVLHPSAKLVLDQYLNSLVESGAISSGNEYLLQPTRNPLNPGNLNKPLNPKTVNYILDKYCKKAGIFKRISPHSARATYIGSALENGVDLWRVSLDVGHESVRTTEIYNKRRSGIKNSPVHSLGFFNQNKKSA
jgi:integrase/recombinase XerD